MNVIAQVRECALTNNNGKQGAKLVLETENPLEVHTIRLNKLHVANGTVAALQSVVGQTVQVPLALEVFNNKTELKVPIDCPFVVPAKPVAAVK